MVEWVKCRSPLFFFAELAAIAGGLDVEPEPRDLLEEFHELQRHFGRNAAAAEHDFVDALRTDAKGSCERILGNAHGNEVVLKENFAGSHGGFHLENFAASRQLLIECCRDFTAQANFTTRRRPVARATFSNVESVRLAGWRS